MNETLVTMVGNVASSVSYGQTAAGVPIANFRMAATERRYDRSRGDWVDGDTNWVTVVVWRWLAANVVSSLNKGDPVVVSGRLRVKEWEEGGRRRTGVEIDARVVGHDLGRGTSAFRWAVQGRAAIAPVSGVEKEAAEVCGGGRFDEEAPAREVATPLGEAVPKWIVDAVRAHRARVEEVGEAGEAAGVAGAEVAEAEAPGEGQQQARRAKVTGRRPRGVAAEKSLVEGSVGEGEVVVV